MPTSTNNHKNQELHALQKNGNNGNNQMTNNTSHNASVTNKTKKQYSKESTDQTTAQRTSTAQLRSTSGLSMKKSLHH